LYRNRILCGRRTRPAALGCGPPSTAPSGTGGERAAAARLARRSSSREFRGLRCKRALLAPAAEAPSALSRRRLQTSGARQPNTAGHCSSLLSPRTALWRPWTLSPRRSHRACFCCALAVPSASARSASAWRPPLICTEHPAAARFLSRAVAPLAPQRSCTANSRTGPVGVDDDLAPRPPLQLASLGCGVAGPPENRPRCRPRSRCPQTLRFPPFHTTPVRPAAL